MILGILSDSHGQSARTRAAVTLLRRLGAEALVHCGDVGGEAVLEQLAGGPAWFVWGNTDVPTAGIAARAGELGVCAPTRAPVELTLGGRRIWVFHGHEPSFERLARAVERGQPPDSVPGLPGVSYVLYGHTHEAADLRWDGVRLINPGALQRARTYTVATLDLADDRLEHWTVHDRDRPGEVPQRYELR